MAKKKKTNKRKKKSVLFVKALEYEKKCPVSCPKPLQTIIKRMKMFIEKK